MPHSESTSPLLAVSGPEECASPSSYLGLKNRTVSSKSPKSVSISRDADLMSPLILGQQKDGENSATIMGRESRKPSFRSHRARRLSGRRSNAGSPNLKALTPALDGATFSDDRDTTDDQHEGHPHLDAFVDQVSTWIKDKRAKRTVRKEKRSARREARKVKAAEDAAEAGDASDASDSSLDLKKLEQIIESNLSIRRPSIRNSSASLKSKPSVRRLLRKQSTVSDNDEVDIVVPDCDAFLDNSKTLAYTGGASDSSDTEGDELRQVPSYRDFDAWAKFKFDIVRIAHTLRLKGWRKVPLEQSSAIAVERLSGALTNAVYVVSPPDDLPLQKQDDAGNLVGLSKPPPKLLLRIYGPQVEHLIDREAELAILQRLARRRIGPRLLGTFVNGRFEEYLHAQPLTAELLRDPDTSRQIAKRMRELHEGIELLDQERSDGAFVWRNWDKWLQRVEHVVTWMDDQIRALPQDAKPTGTQAWMRRGYICGVPWSQFKEVVEKYRMWLKAQYGGSQQVRDQLVFAHNDTQYGNILRMTPTGESPLLLPANTHKQLVVIDFEYANANTRGLEFANHFTEWCYNYHDERKPYAFNPNRYPTPEEQDRFLRAYVTHQPENSLSTPKMNASTPQMYPSRPGDSKRSTSSISTFMLDARAPPTPRFTDPKDDESNKAAEDLEIERLANETRIWRLANTAQWVAWGIVQAKVPGMPAFDEQDSPASALTDGTEPEDLLGERAEEYKQLAAEQAGEEEQEDEEFDYLGYAQHRALFFWGDAVQMGFVKAEDLPEVTRSKLKSVPY